MKSQQKQTKTILAAALGLSLMASAAHAQNREHRPQEQPTQLSGYINLHTNGIFFTPDWWQANGISANDKRNAAMPAGSSETLFIANVDEQKKSAPAPFSYEWRAPDPDKMRAAEEAAGNGTVRFDRESKAQQRPLSPFPEKASPGMFPGSRLRGPFDQVYPRPFYAGGQP